MKRLLKIFASALLPAMLALLVIPAFAEEGTKAETGYDRGYAGGKDGDGTLYAHGIDISVWQGEGFDFECVKAAGLDFVILRAGVSYEKDGVYVTEIDEYFEDNYKNAKAAGVDVGVYFYSMATSAEDALKEAEALLGYIENKKFEYPVYLDFEAPAVRTAIESDPAKAREICKTFMDRIAEEGYLTGMYSSASWIDSGSYNGWMGEVADGLGEKYELWVACYFNDATYYRKGEEYSERFGMYQYTSSKYISGYGGRLDANICYKDYPSIVRKYGFNGYEPDGNVEIGAGGGLEVEESRFRSGKYVVDTGSSKVGAYELPDKDSGAVGYIDNKSTVEVSEARKLWGEDWARVTDGNGLSGWLKASNLKRYTEPAATEETPTDTVTTDEGDAAEGESDGATAEGCGSTVGGGAVLICVCAAVLLKKRKENG